MMRRVLWVCTAVIITSTAVAAAGAGLGTAWAAAPALTLSAAPAQVEYGKQVTLTVQGAVPGSALQMSQMPAGQAAYAPVAQLTADAAGAAVWSGKPERNTTYRVEFAGDGTWEPAVAEVVVAVGPHLALVASRKSGYPGQPLTWKVAAFPKMAGAQVTIEAFTDGAWKPWKTVTLGKDSRASAVWKPDKRGTYSFRATTVAGTDFAAGLGKRKLVSVKRANPYGVPAGPPHFILTDRSQYKLYYFEHGQIVRVFNCVLGMPGLETPLGRFSVYGRGVNPGGPFGVRVLWYHGGHGIHGTNQPWLLSHFPRNYSHGCTRLLNDNALWLFNRCPVGTPVWNVL
jgi:lipoprotein-anchoring transpeptidase ErfK/SrfK